MLQQNVGKTGKQSIGWKSYLSCIFALLLKLKTALKLCSLYIIPRYSRIQAEVTLETRMNFHMVALHSAIVSAIVELYISFDIVHSCVTQ